MLNIANFRRIDYKSNQVKKEKIFVFSFGYVIRIVRQSFSLGGLVLENLPKIYVKNTDPPP